MSAAEIGAHIEAESFQRPEDASRDWTLPGAFAREEFVRRGGGHAWMVPCPFTDPRVRRAWPAMRDLHTLGLHLIALDASRVVIGVETQ